MCSRGMVATVLKLRQKESKRTVLAVLLMFEAVFAVVAGAVILHETMLLREYLGCILMLCAVVLAQLPEKKVVGQLVNVEE